MESQLFSYTLFFFQSINGYLCWLHLQPRKWWNLKMRGMRNYNVSYLSVILWGILCSNFSHCERFCYLYIRIRKTGELLTNIRTLKMYGWDNWFANWLKETRANEVTHLAVWFSTFRNINFLYLQELCIKSYVFVWLFQTRKYLDAWCVFFWATTPTLFSLCTFGLYALMGHQLDAATVLLNLFL